MSSKKSFFSKLRIKNDDESANLGKSLDDFEVETMPEDEDDFEYVEEEQVLVDEDEGDELEGEGEDELEDTDEFDDEVVETEDENQDDLVSEYEGQLTIDVFQTPKEIIIKSTIAGVRPEDIDISIDNDMVTIKGERKNDHEVIEEDYYYQECYWGAFSRSVILPVDVVADKAEAKLKNGILTLRLPKAHQSKTKKISVRAD